MADPRSDLLNSLKPFILSWIGEGMKGIGGGAPSPHDLNSSHHSGQLADAQAPQFLKTDGTRQLTGNMTVASGVKIDGVDISALAAASFLVLGHSGEMTGERTAAAGDGVAFDDGGAKASLTIRMRLATTSGLSFNSGGLQLDDSVAGNGLTIASKILAVGAGDGITVNTSNVALTTPGSLSVSSSNNATGSHTHAVTSSSNPGAAASLLATNSSGHLQLVSLALGVNGLVVGSNQLIVNNSRVGIGTDDPAKLLHVFAAGSDSQLRLSYDATNYTDIFTTSGGSLTVEPTGDVVFNPGGKDLLPFTAYDLNIGALSKKYLTVHAAELWVETLVAQNTMATIGGRILVGPTTILEADVNTSQTFVVVKHNQMQEDDVVYLEADGKVEFMKVTAAPTGSGPYTYTVQRNLDGSGANDWFAGDALFNTGQQNDGFIDIYSIRGVKSGSQAGPTIVGNVRQSATFNDWNEHWAIGNLNGIYGYGSDTYGFAAGKYATGHAWVAADQTNGFRIMHGNNQVARWFAGASGEFAAGDILIGRVAAEQDNLVIKSGGIALRVNTTERISLSSAGILTINDSTGAAVFTFDAADGAEFTKPLTLSASGGIYQGTGTFASPTTGLKLWNDGGIGRLTTYRNGNWQISLNATGNLIAGNGSVVLNRAGLSLAMFNNSGGSTPHPGVLTFNHDTINHGIYGWYQGADPVYGMYFFVGGNVGSKASIDLISAPASERSLIRIATNHMELDEGAPLITGSRAMGARVRRNTGQSASHQTWVSVSFTHARFDNFLETAHWSSTTNPTRLTCRNAGVYLIIGHLAWSNNSTGVRVAEIRVNGSNSICADSKPAHGETSTRHALSAIYNLNLNDYVELRGYQNSGGDLNIVVGEQFSPEFSMIRIA